MSAMTGWRKLRTVSVGGGDMESSRQAILHAGRVLATEEIKAKSTHEVKERLRDLAHNNHFADLIAIVVEDNSAK